MSTTTKNTSPRKGLIFTLYILTAIAAGIVLLVSIALHLQVTALTTPNRDHNIDLPAGLDCQEVTIETTDGLTLSAWYIPGTQPNAIILVHGIHANRTYLLLGCVTGTSPGTPLPDGTILPINWDLLTNFVLAFLNTPIFQNFLGTLDAAGSASATFDTLGPLPKGTAGVVMSFAYALPYSAPGGWFASNAVDIEIIP